MTSLYQLLILQFTAHILADFILQGPQWSRSKETRPLTKQHVWHALIVFAASWLLSFDPGFWKAAVTLAILHFGQDILKSTLKLKQNKNHFFTDQGVHLLMLILVSTGYELYFGYSLPFGVSLSTLATMAGVLLCLKPANIIIKNILDVFHIDAPAEPSKKPVEQGKEEDTKGLPNAGKLIGIVERLLAFLLILFGQYSAVGLIIAAKSILRFRNTKQSEYVLVGTLLSFGIAIFLALLVSKI
jgi:hypothetical protein